jgi:endonuclease G, mitochondrial
MNKTVKHIILFVVSFIVGGFCAYALANPINDNCPQHVVWGAPQIAKEGNNQYLCRTGYAINYDYRTKASYFAVETIKPELLVNKNVSRKDDFREDTEIPVQYRATLKDYQGTGYDRGHMAPAANFTYDARVMSESFLLTNMMPQHPGNNRGIWKYLEEYTRYWAQRYGQLYVITGTYFGEGSGIIGNNVGVPSHVYKIVIDQKRNKAIAFMFPNVKLDPKTMNKYIVSIEQIEQLTGINFSPAMPGQLQGIEKVPGFIGDWQ